MYHLPFYPKHDYGCAHVKSCPHLGGASLGTLVLAARDHGETFRMLHRQLDGERKALSELVEENQRLNKKIDQLKLELRLERQTKFATNKQKAESGQADATAPGPAKKKRKRGAPVGHPGWYRETPSQYDVRVDVPAPRKCSHAKPPTSLFTRARLILSTGRRTSLTVVVTSRFSFTPPPGVVTADGGFSGPVTEKSWAVESVPMCGRWPFICETRSVSRIEKFLGHFAIYSV
jgi:hypothetical protein